MKPFDRSIAHWAAELIDVAAVFFAVGAVHLFVSLLGERAHGELMLLASAAILLTGALLRRRGTTRRHRAVAARQRAAALPDLLAIPAADRELMRLRTTLPDRPGTLARLSGGLAARGINILAVQIHPAEQGAVDELLVAVPRDLTTDGLIAAVAAGGGEAAEASRADVHDLVDPATRALSVATEAASGSIALSEAVRRLLGADLTAEPTYTGAHVATLRGPAGEPLHLVRHSPAFTPTEISRAQALLDLCGRLTGARH